MTLQEFFRENPLVALGFSGGADSAYLLWEAVNNGAQVRPPGGSVRSSRWSWR